MVVDDVNSNNYAHTLNVMHTVGRGQIRGHNGAKTSWAGVATPFCALGLREDNCGSQLGRIPKQAHPGNQHQSHPGGHRLFLGGNWGPLHAVPVGECHTGLPLWRKSRHMGPRVGRAKSSADRTHGRVGISKAGLRADSDVYCW